MGGCQHYGPFLGTLNIKGRIILGTQKETIILTTTHIDPIVENQMEKKMEHEMDTGFCKCS